MKYSKFKVLKIIIKANIHKVFATDYTDLHRLKIVMKYNIYRFTTLISLLILSVSCGSSKKAIPQIKPSTDNVTLTSTSTDVAFKTGAENFESYLPLLKDKRVGIVTNQTGILSKEKHLVDFLIEQNINLQKIYAPEHGFRGTADAGELIVDGNDSKTN